VTIEEDRYFSVDTGPEVELRVLASRFAAQAFRADDDDVGRALVDAIRRRYHDASHHCWASRLGEPGAVVDRADDAGEPGGTAGAPILAAIAHAGLHDTLVVVTRWFGGTKLGTGGLARAYGDAARAALEAAPRRELWREAVIVVECNWPDVGAVEAVLAREGRFVRRCTRDFAAAPRFEVAVLRGREGALRDAIREGTGARARVG
jgi:putative IMPACT (imprinted ancient) family translation regulator